MLQMRTRSQWGTMILRCADCHQPLLPNPDPKPNDRHLTCYKCSMKRARFLFPALRSKPPPDHTTTSFRGGRILTCNCQTCRRKIAGMGIVQIYELAAKEHPV